MKENIVLQVEDHPGWCIETNIAWEKNPKRWIADLYDEREKDPAGIWKPSKLVESFKGEHALTDAVLHLSDLLNEPVAHKVRKKPDLFLCQGCGHELQFEDGDYCMSCLVDQAEDQGFRWGEYR